MIIGTQNVRTCALMFIVLIYLMFGAAVFNALESKEEARQRAMLRLRMARILYKNDTIQNESVFNSLTTAIFENRHVRSGTAKQWTFPGAFYFSTLVVTLIGYGHTTPKTKGGKIFCMVYTVAGVPLNLIMFQSVGERLNAIISFVLSRLKRLFGFRRHKVSGFELIAVEFGMTTMLVLGGSFIFCKQERWSYFESIYYSLVTFWTIGFGDLVPLASVQRTGHSLYSRWGYFIYTISFILFGLAIMASSLNLLVLRLAQFHSENGIGGISDVLGRNEEDLIAAAIAEHRASISIQQRNRICSNVGVIQQQKALSSYLPIKTYSWWSLSSSSSKSDSSTNPQVETACCSGYSLITCRKRKRRHWQLRRSPQNIKHLLYFNQMLENHKLVFVRKQLMPNRYNHQMANHISEETTQKQHRVSI
ncbi:unnamed protein product [Rotaria magnacalcarata]|uniref:Potassium channel domain-containing protein n=2 Tax=Rotaria magnacalcarata TaxID=392030 RepID=A0A816RFL7_9BILA|nr:unnamed protein product [Rotaria magnacalcarata]CAF1917781.1 unnamed protein product [Rotaria magnacalcarata]CAF2073293.1 unnamed protein product [Rotaria magnacalcarata]CAF3749697.1 unnamed protein product [Rotaria magnacalcarata]CAF3795713.1 unnamed protein product [Rotaria magnacalcarata]